MFHYLEIGNWKLEIRGALVATFAFAALIMPAAAQTEPQVIISWRAQTFTPPEYTGKALPISGAKVTASLDILQTGKLADLSKEMLYWYVNNHLILSGKGAVSISFRAPEELRGSFDLRVEAPSYRNGALIHAITIPIVRPEAIIAAPFPEKKVTSPLSLRATPYFFNITDPLELLMQWTVNGELVPQRGDPSLLNATVGGNIPGTPISVALSMFNPAIEFETAQASVTLTTQ